MAHDDSTLLFIIFIKVIDKQDFKIRLLYQNSEFIWFKCWGEPVAQV